MGERNRKITIKDIAAEAGVSIALVSFVMNGKSEGKNAYRVNKETAERIRSVAERLNYQPNEAARVLRSGKTNAVGVIVSDISNKFFADIARCIEDRAYKHKYTVLFGSTDENPQKLENLIDVFRNKGVDGLIVVPCEGAEQTLRKLANENFPLVLLDREVPGAELSSVVLNNRRAGYQVAEVLVRQGFRRIEMVSYSMNLSNIRVRVEGYRSCMTENGLGEYVRIHHLRHERLDRIVEVLRDVRSRQVEAFVFATNTLAMQGVTAMFRMGWQVPRDCSMVCFDTNEAFDLYHTAAACVSQPIERFGAEALDLLLKSIEHRDQPMACTRVVLTPEIVEYAGAESLPEVVSAEV